MQSSTHKILVTTSLVLLATCLTLVDSDPIKAKPARPIGAYCEGDFSTECETPLVCRNFECKCESRKCACDYLEIWQNGKCRNRAKTLCTVAASLSGAEDTCVQGAKCVGMVVHGDSAKAHESAPKTGICECVKSSKVIDGLCSHGQSIVGNGHSSFSFIIMICAVFYALKVHL